MSRHIHIHFNDAPGDFDESKHKRGPGGQFGSGGGSAAKLPPLRDGNKNSVTNAATGAPRPKLPPLREANKGMAGWAHKAAPQKLGTVSQNPGDKKIPPRPADVKLDPKRAALDNPTQHAKNIAAASKATAPIGIKSTAKPGAAPQPDKRAAAESAEKALQRAVEKHYNYKPGLLEAMGPDVTVPYAPGHPLHAAPENQAYIKARKEYLAGKGTAEAGPKKPEPKPALQPAPAAKAPPVAPVPPGPPKPGSSPATPKPHGGEIYWLQAGAFSDEKEADNLWNSSRFVQMFAVRNLSLIFGCRFGCPPLWSRKRHEKCCALWREWWSKKKGEINWDADLRLFVESNRI